MKIVQIVSATGLNGAVRHCHDLTRELAMRGHQVILAHESNAWIARQSYPEGVELFETSLARRPREFRRVGEAFRERRIDVIHSHNSSAHFFSVVLAQCYGFPKVATCHMPHLQPHWWWNDRVIAPAASTAKYQRWVNGVPSRRIDTIPYFIDAGSLRPDRSREEVRESLGISPETFLITCVGEVCKRKNQILLLRALLELKRLGHTAGVLLAGRLKRDYAVGLKSFIHESGLSDEVKLLGVRSDLPNLMAASDCFCLPSNREVMPISCIEAMGSGLAVVITDTGGIGELLEGGSDALIVPRNDLGALTAALAAVAGDLRLRQQLTESARGTFARVFSPDSCVDRIVESYRRARRQKLGSAAPDSA